MAQFTIEVSDSINLMTGDKHKVATIDMTRLSNSFVAEAFVKSLKIAAMNTYNGGGKDATATEKQAKLDKRIASWYRGEWAIVERGEGIYTAFKDEVFIPMCIEQGMTLKDATALIQSKVAEHFPQGTKATFGNFLAATAIESADEFDGDRGAAQEAIESWYESELDKRRAAREKVAKKIEAPSLDLSAFKKKAKK